MSEWIETTLGEICSRGGGNIQTGPFGSQLHASDYVEMGIPSVMPQNIGDNTIIEAGIARITEADADRLSKYRLRTNDIVYSRRGDVERRSLVRTENDGWLCGTGCLKVNFGNAPVADPTFISHYLGTEEAREWIVRHAVGATMLNLNTKILSAVPLTIPPLHEQQAIAEVLGALDDKIAANTKLAATAHDLAAHIYDQSTSSLGTVPMSTVLSPVLGGTPPRQREDYWSGDQLWASAKDITGADFSTVVDTGEKISLSAAEKTKAKPLPAGSVILTARGTVGAIARLAVPASFNQSCYGFVPGAVPPSVLYFAILQATRRAKAIAHGSVFDTITMKTFDHLEFPNFAGASMADTDAKIAPLLDTITAAVLENQHLAATRDALLPQLMSGKLRVKHAEALLSAAV